MMIKFNLSISIDNATKVSSKDSVFISGSPCFLGKWSMDNMVEMKLKTTDDNCSLSSLSSFSSASSYEVLVENQTVEFEAFVNADDLFELTTGEIHHYRYLLAQKTSQKGKVFMKQVEHSWRKLTLDTSSNIVVISDKWPYYDEDNKLVRVDSCWLSAQENEFQFHFFNNPLQLWTSEDESDVQDKKYAIEVRPWKAGSGAREIKDYSVTHLDFDENVLQCDKTNTFNALNNPNVFTSFRIRSFEKPSDLMFQINIYEFNEYGMLNDKCFATSYYKVNKNLLDSALIDIDLSLLSSSLVIGSLRAEILMITSLNEPQNANLTKCYNYHFKQSCITIGHRGMGKTFDADESLPSSSFVENTIDSFREAHSRGAQMVEFDVVLTKDKIPIIYHDFTFCIDHQHNEANANKYIDIAVNQLTYEEIKQNRIYSHKILKKLEKIKKPSDRDNYTSKLMFPTLKEMCYQLDSTLGFNVEIKYPLDLEDGTHEAGTYIKWLNRNEYVDVILKELYECCQDDQRCVILTTFDPNLCSMLGMKQNKFPVLFLTNGKTTKWIPYKDFRCKNTQISFNYARSEGLHGIVAHAEELVQNLHLISIIFNHTTKSANFWSYSWGDDLNELEKRKLFSQHGINGIIYDRVNELN